MENRSLLNPDLVCVGFVRMDYPWDWQPDCGELRAEPPQKAE